MKKILNFMVGALIILIIQYLCTIILRALNITFPAAVLGIIVLFLLLKLNIIKEDWIKDFSEFILKYMILFFIPLFAGVIAYYDIISKNLSAIIATIFITTTLVMVSVGLIVENVVKFRRLFNIRKSQK